jgi:hypothetical protein
MFEYVVLQCYTCKCKTMHRHTTTYTWVKKDGQRAMRYVWKCLECKIGRHSATASLYINDLLPRQ